MVDLEFDVVDLGEADNPEPGEMAPDFTRPLVTEEFWENRTLSQLAGETDGLTVLVFTPMVGSFVGKYVGDELHDRGWHDAVGQLVGITISSPYAIKRFLADNEYPFPFFSDPANEIAETYGIVNDLDGMDGISEPRPAVLALESDLTVAAVWVAREWPDFPEYDVLEAELGIE